MIVDFHCHTRKIKSGDGAQREVDETKFAEKISNSNVKIVAITNHNTFDKEQFETLRTKVKEHCKVWPGVELDIGYQTSKRYHLIVICNPKNTQRFSEAVESLMTDKTPENFLGEIENVVEVFSALDCIFMPHFHKSPAIPDDEYARLEELLPNKNRLIAEATNVRSMGIFVNHNINCVAGSDIKDWDNYPGIELPELRLDIDEYEHLCDLLDRDSALVKTLLDKNSPVVYEVYPCKNNNEIKEKIKLYKEVNVIFGDKGTGKSQVIVSLIRKLKTEDIPFSKYISSETKDDLDELLDTSDMIRSAESLEIDSCEEEFSQLEQWGDKSPTPLMDYYEYHRTSSANTSEKRIGWNRMTELPDDTSSHLEKIEHDLENVSDGYRSIHKIRLADYITEQEAVDVTNLLRKLMRSMEQKKHKAYIEQEAVGLVNFTIETIKSYTSAKIGSAVRPSNTGFGQYAKNRLMLKEALSKINHNLRPKERVTYEILGNIGGKGRIDIEKRYRMLNDIESTKSSHKEFQNNITKLRPILNDIKAINHLTLSVDLEQKLGDLKEQLEVNCITSTGDFVGIYKQTVDKDHNPYELSNGERSIIFIQKALNNTEAKIYLLDEPELSMANSYIDEVIRPKITALGKQKKTVVIATHNANIAVRTLPYTTIYRAHNTAGYVTYVGNSFTNKLVNINDETDVRNWKETSMKILEGGKEAFYERRGIYESGRN